MTVCNSIFGKDKPYITLVGAIDDATGKFVGAIFRPTEDLVGYFEVLRQIVSNYGVPLAVYTDRHSIFVSPNADKLSIEDQLASLEVNLTQFGRALNELGIDLINARSLQAKGRVERLWETLQDSLKIELALAKAETIEQANAFLQKFRPATLTPKMFTTSFQFLNQSGHKYSQKKKQARLLRQDGLPRITLGVRASGYKIPKVIIHQDALKRKY